MSYKVTTKKEWFLCPVGRPLRNDSEYIATDRKVFTGGKIPTTCYKINGTWHNENCFTKIEQICKR